METKSKFFYILVDTILNLKKKSFSFIKKHFHKIKQKIIKKWAKKHKA
jgi:hypothetical protein